MTLKYNFYDDYSEGAHPQILEALMHTNLQQQIGYGMDEYSTEASNLIKEKIENKNIGVHFVSGGTQANLVVLGSMLKPYESVIAASSAHIDVHEAGAIEATGHKIHAVEVLDGKLLPEQIKKIVNQHTDEHMVRPRVVFISHSTEVGTIYTKKELENLSQYCKTNGLYLYLDGARMASALASTNTDLTLADIARFADAFYIGGTKNGALLGEAIVLVNPNLQNNFRYHTKQRGALLAKGRSVVVQFRELFKGDLFFDLARHANDMASKLTQGLQAQGYTFLTESFTNQIFPILPNAVIKRLQESYGFYIWSKSDDKKSVVRLVTSWAD